MQLLEEDMEGGLNQPNIHYVFLKQKRKIKKLCPCKSPDNTWHGTLFGQGGRNPD